MAKASKVAVLGVDAMDPRLTRKYIDMGIMPNTKKILEAGAAREDLVLLGALPTVTPPQWTTLATGAYPSTHGITAFYRQGGDLDMVNLNFDSTKCHAEQMWNVTAEAGKKTLVWHWPGSAWPPSSDSENLHVVDGTSPGGVNMSSAQVDGEFIVMASDKNETIEYRSGAMTDAKVPCVVTGLGDDKPKQKSGGMASLMQRKMEDGFRLYIVNPNKDGQGGSNAIPADIAFSSIKQAEKWAADVPADAKEFVVLLSGGLIRRPALILKGEDGKYDHIAIYKNKKQAEPMVVMKNREYVRDIVDDCMKGDDLIKATRDMRVLEIAEDGSKVKMWVSASMNIEADMMWHPRALYKEIVDNVGYPSPCSTLGFGDFELIYDCMHQCWEHVADFQADSLNYLMENNDYEVIFSHFHAPDLQKHMFIRDLAKGTENTTAEQYEFIMQEIYRQTDRYLGKFVHFLDKGWTLMVVSDHAQVCPKYGLRGLGDTGCNIQIMEELGYTVREVNPETGKKKRRMDWTKTTAVANREMHIYLNIKGRNQHTVKDADGNEVIIDGLIDPADQYEWEEKIITDLYNIKDKETGKRIIAWALRNKDAIALGLGGPDSGDIIYCMAEGYEHDHDDSMATALGECDTSAGPIFLAAGPGIKKGVYTDRMIRQVDVAPTIASIMGLRMPAQCEGAPIYQIIED
ncbi:MAG: alkaline phosphatase family protein [Peptococcaceae bacterium]|nr:alkaline phosphatase family protein [Peptococcaceae bacterium]MBQ5703215.1 alkaline phosphatase family protein [Peptococcaceae bacterium]